MDKPLSIFIFDGSLNTTPFINRLAEGLAKKHKVFILGFDDILKKRLPRIHYISVGTAAKPKGLIWKTLGNALRQLLTKGSIKGLSTLFQFLANRNKKKLQQYNLEVAIARWKPTILHVQWPSLLPWCEPFWNHPTLKIVLSQRGYQNNVRPFINEKNRAYLQQCYPKIHGFHSVSKALKAVGNAIYQAPEKIDKVVYSGFDVETFEPRVSPKEKTQQLQIISVGRAHWKKGYPDAIRACTLLKEQGIPFHYTIIGATSNEEVLYLVHENELMDSITLLDRIPQQQVYERMKESDVLLLPSLEEGVANVVLEAMLLGTPVVSTDCGGMKEFIFPKETGWLVPLRDPSSMAQALKECWQTPLVEIEQITSAARKQVISHCTTAQMVEGMESLYLEVMKL